MSYSTVAEVAKETGHKDGSSDAGGIIAQAVASAFLMVKARIKARGLTPPSSDDTLKAAEIELCRAKLIRRMRMDGSLPKGEGSFDTYDSVNKAIKLHTDEAWELVDAYISAVSTNVQPYDTDGKERADLVGDQFKLDQNDFGEFSD